MGETRLASSLAGLVDLGHDELLYGHVGDVLRDLGHRDSALDRWTHLKHGFGRVLILLYLYVVLVHDTSGCLVLPLERFAQIFQLLVGLFVRRVIKVVLIVVVFRVVVVAVLRQHRLLRWHASLGDGFTPTGRRRSRVCLLMGQALLSLFLQCDRAHKSICDAFLIERRTRRLVERSLAQLIRGVALWHLKELGRTIPLHNLGCQ